MQSNNAACHESTNTVNYVLTFLASPEADPRKLNLSFANDADAVASIQATLIDTSLELRQEGRLVFCWPGHERGR